MLIAQRFRFITQVWKLFERLIGPALKIGYEESNAKYAVLSEENCQWYCNMFKINRQDVKP